MRVWQRGDRRAVHKPLLVLFALGRLARGEAAFPEFSAVEGELGRLLFEFGPSGSERTRHNPFWHLKTDGLWELHGPASLLDRPAGATPTITELRAHHVAGDFPAGLRTQMQRDPGLVEEIASRIVQAHFPESIRQDVLDAVGLGGEQLGRAVSMTTRARRDPAFRERVLVAYEYRCCVCGHDLRLGSQVIGLEAAHIKWFNAGGPDIECNGLALCSLHHKIFDLGAFTVLPDGHQIAFSQHMVGGSETQARLLAHHGASLVQPQCRDYAPNPDFLAWHRREVFKEPQREV